MNYLDVIIIIILVWFAYKGYAKGFVYQILSLFGLFAAFYLSFFVNDFFTDLLKESIPQVANVARTLAYVAVFLITLTSFYVLAAIITKALKVVFLDSINKITGVIFGLFKAAIVILFFTYFTAELKYKDSKLISSYAKGSSMLYDTTYNIAESVVPAVFPNGSAEKLRSKLVISK